MAITVYPPEAAEDYERISENFEQSVQRAAIAYHTEMLDETISDTLALTHFQQANRDAMRAFRDAMKVAQYQRQDDKD